MCEYLDKSIRPNKKIYVFPVTDPDSFIVVFVFFTIESSHRKMFSVSSLFLLKRILKITLLKVFCNVRSQWTTRQS